MEYMGGKELEETLIYQDFVNEQMYKLGLPINPYSSRKYNIEKGESIGRVEIKNDKMFSKTGNLYIEFAEKQNKNNKEYVKSGIFREDNTLFWFIGDFKRAWLFCKKDLKMLCRNYEKYKFKPVITETSKGVLIPIKFLDEHKEIFVQEFYFESDENDRQ